MEDAKIDERHVGIIIGGTNIEKFNFIIRTDLEPDERPIIGDIVRVFTDNEIIYGIITDIRIRTVDPLQLGRDYEAIEFFMDKIKNSEQHQIAQVFVLGALRKDSVHGRLQRPRFPPSPGIKVYLPSGQELEKLYGKDPNNPHNYIEIGNILGLREEISPALDKREIIIKHMAIFGMTGAGKSHTVATAIKELSDSGVPIIVFDVHRDYIWAFKRSVIFTFSEEEAKYLRNYLNVSGDVTVCKFALSDIRYNLPELLGISFKTQSRMFSILSNLVETENIETISGLLEKLNSPTVITSNDSADEKARIGLVRRVSVLNSFKIFKRDNRDNQYANPMDIINLDIGKFLNLDTMIPSSESSDIYDENLKQIADDIENEVSNSQIKLYGKKYSNFIKPYQVTIVDLFPLSIEEQKAVIYLIMDRVFKLAKEMKKRGKVLPIVMVVEEAHRFTTDNAISSRIMGVIAREGRKFGVGIWIVSQMPSKISEGIVSQANTFILQRLTNPKDLNFITSVCPYLSKEYINSITKFERGEALVVGLGVRYPVMIKIKPGAKIGGSEKEIEDTIKTLYYSRPKEE